MPDLTLVPSLTPDQKEAIRECRFKTTNVAREVALVYDADLARIEATGLIFTRYKRAPQGNPGMYDYEARSGDPEVVAFVASLPAHRREAVSPDGERES